jgi:hypothetical protein
MIAPDCDAPIEIAGRPVPAAELVVRCVDCGRSLAGHLYWSEALWLAMDGDLPTDSVPDTCKVCGVTAISRSAT